MQVNSSVVPIRAPELHGCALESSFQEGVKRERLRSLAQVLPAACHKAVFETSSWHSSTAVPKSGRLQCLHLGKWPFRGAQPLTQACQVPRLQIDKLTSHPTCYREELTTAVLRR